MKRLFAIYGYGYVGKEMEKLLNKHYEVVISDPAYKQSASLKQLAEAEAAVVCVPTPASEDGSVDTSIVEEVVRQLPQHYVLIASTVPPGTTERLALETGKEIVFSPEFISESTYKNPYYTSMTDTNFVILGGKKGARKYWRSIYQPIHGPTVTYFESESSEAEFTKYMANIYSALKITFVNEMYDVAKSLGVDWDIAREAWLLDQRVEPMSTMVFANKRGFSGKCLPKDLLGLISAAKDAGFSPKLLQTINRLNAGYAGEEVLSRFVPTQAVYAVDARSAGV